MIKGVEQERKGEEKKKVKWGREENETFEEEKEKEKSNVEDEKVKKRKERKGRRQSEMWKK